MHLGTEKTWRGGENQARLLMEGLASKVEFQAAATPRDSIAYREKRWSCETLGLPSGNPLNPLNALALVQFIKKHRINLVDAHTAKAHSLALKALAFLPDVKLVVHRRVDNVPKASLWTRRKYFHNRVDRYTAISRFIAQVLVDYGISPKKIRVARSAVSDQVYRTLDSQAEKAQWKQKYSIPDNHILIGNASALSPQKGYETLLKGAAELQKRRDDFTVLIAGDGPLKESLMRMTRDLNLQQKIIFTGFIRNVPQFLTALDILAVPSNNEGLGTVILDGFLASCAVVGSEVGGIPEIVIPRKTGLLQKVGDYTGLADNLNFLMDHPDKRVEWAETGRQYVKSEFSLDSMVQGNLKIYQELFNNPL